MAESDATPPVVAPRRIRIGEVTVTGSLAVDVVKHIVGLDLGRFRLCYERGLERDPNLTGAVTSRFTIDARGAVTKIERDPITTMADAEVVDCVIRDISRLTFPAEHGVVTVVFPVSFAPGL